MLQLIAARIRIQSLCRFRIISNQLCKCYRWV